MSCYIKPKENRGYQNPRKAVETPKQCLKVVLEWMQAAKLKLNPDKMVVQQVEGRSDP